jgi:hypothetical protein
VTVVRPATRFLPWLGGIFETIEFPGGGKVQWRAKVEAEQLRQARELASVVQFLTDGFLTEPERQLLHRIVSVAPLPIGGPTRMSQTLQALTDPKPPATLDAEFVTVQDAYKITSKGRRYLDLISQAARRRHGTTSVIRRQKDIS